MHKLVALILAAMLSLVVHTCNDAVVPVKETTHIDATALFHHCYIA